MLILYTRDTVTLLQLQLLLRQIQLIWFSRPKQ